jgi:hypothetical protein
MPSHFATIFIIIIIRFTDMLITEEQFWLIYGEDFWIGANDIDIEDDWIWESD